ncbi:hypothetical protein SAMN06295888_12247 [Desulfonatronum zhilinae]|nr:hypothetical protein SAMN06295888_12247 [Desulfonatronum zhilinae]
MAVIIADPVQFSKKTAKMLKSGGNAEGAARQAREIIQDLADSGRLDPSVARKLTPNGEARMENCWKFNLPGGHRLVLTRQEEDYVFLFLGTHDETDTWIKNNSGIKLDISGGEVVSGAAGGKDHPDSLDEYVTGTTLAPSATDDDYYERPLHEFIDQNMLREIFSGLCQGPGMKIGNETSG